MSISSIGSSFQFVDPAAAVRETRPAEAAQVAVAVTASETLTARTEALATGPQIAGTTPFQRLMDRQADAAVGIQEAHPAGAGATPRSASDAYRATAASTG